MKENIGLGLILLILAVSLILRLEGGYTYCISIFTYRISFSITPIGPLETSVCYIYCIHRAADRPLLETLETSD